MIVNGIYDDILENNGKVVIRNNVFVRMNATTLKGTTIDNNTIIGINALVRGGIYPPNCVIIGNSAKIVCTIGQYREKRVAA